MVLWRQIRVKGGDQIINHKPWVGADYERGIDSQNVLIVGFSHHGEPDKDDLTLDAIRDWAMTNEARFFRSIRSYFGATDGSFWKTVAFINSLPSSVGEDEKRYDWGTPEQRSQVPMRVRKIMNDLEPSKVIIFTKKGWACWPQFDGSIGQGVLPVEGAEGVEWGSYRADHRDVLAYGLRHPQFAVAETMKRCVAAILEHDPHPAE